MAEQIQVTDMRCENCANSIRKALVIVDGVAEISFDLPGKTVTVNGTADRKHLLAAIRQAGFTPR